MHAHKLLAVFLFAVTVHAVPRRVPRAPLVVYPQRLSAAFNSGAAGVSCGTWAHCIQITIAHGQAGTVTSSNFPLLVVYTSSGVGSVMKTAGNGGHIQHTVTQSGGSSVTEPADLVYGSTAGCSTTYPYETLYYSASGTASGSQAGGYLEQYAQIPSVSTSVDTTFWVCYDASGVSTQQNTGTMAPSHVWDSNYQVVYHAEENAGNTTVTDSTSNANTGTGYANTSTLAANGEIASAFSANSNTQLIVSGSNVTATGNWTVETWGFLNGAQGGFSFFAETSAGGNIFMGTDNTHWYVGAGANGGSTGNPVTNSAWVHAVLTWDNTAFAMVLYINGSVNYSHTFGGASGLSNGVIRFGWADNVNYNGTIDECRFSNTIRSASYVTLSQNAEKAASTLLTFGAEN